MLRHIKPQKGIAVERMMVDIEGQAPGPTMVVVVGMHGNEVGGVIAAFRLIERLRQQQIPLHGRFVCLAGNLGALELGVRHLDCDLNRIWDIDGDHLCADPNTRELKDFYELKEVMARLEAQSTEPLVVLDLHSFSGKGEPFVIAPGPNSPDVLMRQMPFPIIHGLNQYISGTFCTYLDRCGHRTLVMEGGRDGDPDVPLHMESFLWHALAQLAMMDGHFIPPYARRIWQELFDREGDLPRHIDTFHRQALAEDDGFVMRPGFRTFDKVSEGQVIADDGKGPIACPEDGYLLMPLYQEQGEDGFFLGRQTGLDIA